jgi:hypothetical protein
MSMKHRPDYEMQLMQRVLRDLEKLSQAGRKRVIMYWLVRSDEMPDSEGVAGAQQLDIEDVPNMPALRGAA